MSREGFNHQYLIRTRSWRPNHDHKCGLLGQPGRYCASHKRRVAPLHGLLHYSGGSPAQLGYNRCQSTHSPAWTGDKIIHSRRHRSLLWKFYRVEETIDI
jgi:hypothetical protein